MLSLKDLRYCPHFTANEGFAVAISRKTTKAPETLRLFLAEAAFGAATALIARLPLRWRRLYCRGRAYCGGGLFGVSGISGWEGVGLPG